MLGTSYILHLFIRLIIVNRGDWLGSPANIKGANKDAKIYVGRSATLHNLLFCPHTLCMNYVTNTFLLVSSSVRSTQLLCFVHGQGQKSEQKHTTKNFVGFHNHSPLLTMVTPKFAFRWFYSLLDGMLLHLKAALSIRREAMWKQNVLHKNKDSPRI